MTSPIVVVGTEAAVVQVARGAAGPPGPQGPSGTGGSGGVIVPVALTGDDSDDGLGSAALALGAAAQAQAQAVAQAAGAAAGIYAPLASPALTGTPTAPTASPLTDDTQIATTAYVDSAVAAIPIASAPTTNSPAPTLTLGLIDDPDDPTNYAGVRNSPSSATPGTYGSATQAPSITVDRFGCISSVVADTVTPAWSSVTSIPPVLTTDNIPLAAAYALSFGDDWDEPIPSAANPLGSQPGVTPGTYGDASDIPVLAVDSYGRVTAASTVPAAGGSYPAAATVYAAQAGTYTISAAPVGTTLCRIGGWGSGGGGGSGACQTSGLAGSGGGGGAGAMYNEVTLPVASLVFPLTVTSPLGGAGGGGKGTTASAGNGGTHGGQATVTDGNGKQLFIADGSHSLSSGGQGGQLAGNSTGGSPQTSSASGAFLSYGSAGVGGTNGAAGTTNNNGYGNGASISLGAAGGSSGGGVSTTPAAFAGGTGIVGPYTQGSQTGATAGTLGGGNAGAPPANYDGALLPGAGGGGGGSSITGNGGSGSNGGSYGAGGGGGGACLTGSTSGAGGNGGPGVVVVQFV